MTRSSIYKTGLWSAALALLALLAFGYAQSVPSAVQAQSANQPRVLDTNDHKIRVVPLAQGLSNPWSIAFLPNGQILVTEKSGRLRIIRDGVLQAEPITGTPDVRAARQGGLMDIALHPRFQENNLIYLTYSKSGERGGTTALARARFEGTKLVNLQDIFVADAWSDTDMHYGSRIAFGKDGMIYMTIGERNQRQRAQNPAEHTGSILRLNEDGTVPEDNPFVGKAGFKPEIYSYGHRNPQGLAVHPETGVIWDSEHGPMGGDEVNIIQSGRNYGWPIVTFGREYDGRTITEQPWKEGMEQPRYYWVPSIGISGVSFYTGDKFPAWKGHMFVGGLSHMLVQRVRVVGQRGGERENMLTELRHRIRDVRQGPDGFLYVIADANAARAANSGMILRIEPAM